MSETANGGNVEAGDRWWRREYLISQTVMVITIVIVVVLGVVSDERGLTSEIDRAQKSTPSASGIPIIRPVLIEPVLCASGGSGAYPIVEGALAEDCAALLEAAPVLFGSEAVGWRSDAPITEWQGVILGGDPVRVVALDLTTSGLSGQVPQELGQLSGLQALHLYGNRLTGRIPPELADLTTLTILDLGANQLTGEVPPGLGGLASLTSLDLSFNQLTGPIPAEFSKLDNLEWLVVAGNDFTGSVNGLFDDLTKLNYISIYETKLTGCLPAALQDIDGFKGDLQFCDDG